MAEVVSTASISFDGNVYKVKKVPGGKPVSCEAIDVTCADDTKKQFVPGALLVNGEIAVTVAAETPPDENSVGALVVVRGSSSIPCGDAIVKSVTPSTIEASGNRESTWDVVFQPAGSDPASEG